MKRIVLLILAFSLLLSLSACGAKSEPAYEGEYASQEAFLDAMAKGISNRLKNVNDGKQRTDEEKSEYYIQLVKYELEQIETYEDLVFADPLFNELAHGYINACKMQLVGAQNYRNSNLYDPLWSGGSTIRNGIICEFYSRYNLPITSEEASQYSPSASSGGNVSLSLNGTLNLETGLTFYSDNMKTYDEPIIIKKDSSQVLFNDHDIKITLKSLEINDNHDYYVNLTIENSRTSDSVTCFLGKGYVDDYKVSLYHHYGYDFAAAGKKCDTYSNIDYTNLKDIGMTNFNTLSCYLYVVTAPGDSTAQYIAKIPLEISRTAFS